MTSFKNAVLKLPYYINRKFILAILKKELNKSAGYYAPQKPGVLYIAASCLPCHISGYTSRTHEILRSLADIYPDFKTLTRPGYPWDRKDTLVFPEDDGTLLDGIQYDHLRQPTRMKHVVHYALAAAKAVENYAMKHSVGCIHAASNHVNALPGLIAARKRGLKFQYEMRGLWELTRASRFPEYENSPPYNLGLELEGFVAKHADRVFTISEQLKLYAIKRWKIPERRIEILPNCVDPNHIKPDNNICVKPGLIGYAGSLINYEGLDTLLEAMAILKTKNVPVNLRIIGEGEAKKSLESLCANLDLQDRVQFLGRQQPELARQQLQECALICIPRKPFEVCKIVTPIKLVEAMAIGKPVIVPDLPVFRDEVGQKNDELFFKSGNPTDLAARLEKAISEPDLFSAIGQMLRQKVLDSRQWKQHVGAILPPLDN